MKTVNDSHDGNYSTLAMDGLITYLPRYIGHDTNWTKHVLPVLLTLVKRGHLTEVKSDSSDRVTGFAIPSRFDRDEYDRRIATVAAACGGGW